jgi:hypothetical protein
LATLSLKASFCARLPTIQLGYRGSRLSLWSSRDAPAELQGALIAVGHSLDAFAVVGKALCMATTDVFMVDPYADAKLLTDLCSARAR